MLAAEGSSLQWNVSFFRAAQDWEIDVFFDSFHLLYTTGVREGVIDKKL